MNLDYSRNLSRPASSSPSAFPATARFELTAFGRYHHLPGVEVPLRQAVNCDLHLIHVVRGRGFLLIDGRRIRIDTASVVFVPPFCYYACGKQRADELEMINCHFQLTLPNGQPIGEVLTLPRRFVPATMAELHVKLRQWWILWEQGGVLDRCQVAASLHQQVANYVRDFGQPRSADATADPMVWQLRRAMEHVRLHRFDAAALARTAGLSVSQMNRRFTRAVGMPPKQYWMRTRLVRVQSCLQKTDFSIAEAASIFGFADVYYFSRWFKRHAGISPLRYRRQSRLTPV